jgi:hypothetical protein
VETQWRILATVGRAESIEQRMEEWKKKKWILFGGSFSI